MSGKLRQRRGYLRVTAIDRVQIPIRRSWGRVPKPPHQAAPLRGAGPGVRARLSLDEARLAHAGPHLPAPLISKAHPGRSSVLHSRLPGA